MKNLLRADSALAALMILAAAGLLSTLLAYPAFASETVSAIAAVPKLVLLLVGYLFAAGNARRFDTGDSVKPAWQALALGLLACLAGQLSFAPYQLWWRIEQPFPSLGDAFFVASYPLFGVALLRFLGAYLEAGYPAGTAGERWTIAGVMTALGGLACYPILKPIWAAQSPLVEKALNTAYPLLDFMVLIPTLILVRATLPLRGGEVWKAWAAILGGFAFMCAGDILFACVSGLGELQLDALMHATYVLAYGLVALGVVRQHRLLEV